MENLLTISIFLPITISILLIFSKPSYAKAIATITSFANLIIIIFIWFLFDNSNINFQFITKVPIIPYYGISYFIGIDGISITLILLSTILGFISTLLINNENDKQYYLSALLSLEGILIGVFSSLDMVLFYSFWELSLIPVLYIIGNFGGNKKIYASIKFFIYTISTSLIMFLGILYLAYNYYSVTGIWSFNLMELSSIAINEHIQNILFFAFMIGIAVKIPLFPLHTWLPSTYSQAPTAGLVMIAGVLSKIGIYALIRFVLPLFPDASIIYIIPISIICIIMIIYGAMIAFIQNNIKQTIAYSSISHIGIITLGAISMNIEGISGSILFMFAHGIISSGLFILIGILIEKTQQNHIDTFGGLARSMPKCTILFSILLMGSVSLPLTIGFAGEFLSLLGFFKVNKIITIIAGSSIILVAVYMLNLFKKIFLGKEKYIVEDINKKQVMTILPLAVICIWFGIFPNIILNKTEESINKIINTMYENSNLYESKKLIMQVKVIGV